MLPRKLIRGDKFVVLYDLWNELIDHLQSIRPVAGTGITLQRLSAGTVISTVRTSGKSAAGVSAGADDGPFAVTIENVNEGGDQTDWRVKLHNSASESGVAGMVTIGSRRMQIEDQVWEPKPGVVILDIVYDGDTEEYDVLFSLEDEIPETTDEKRYILRIAEISYDENSETWSAAQIRPVGDIEVTGRWVK